MTNLTKYDIVGFLSKPFCSAKTNKAKRPKSHIKPKIEVAVIDTGPAIILWYLKCQKFKCYLAGRGLPLTVVILKRVSFVL